jgi:hypothetical protein
MNDLTKEEKKSLEWDCNKPYGIIYKGTCGNGKVYIGLTTRKIEARVKQHIKSGKIGFDWEVIDQAWNKEQLIEKEKYWIKNFDAMNPAHGYNRKNGNAGMSKEAINDLKIHYYSRSSFFNYTTNDSKYEYRLDKNKAIDIYESWNDTEITDIQLCLLNEFLYLLAKGPKKYRISNRTLLLDIFTVEKICSYITDEFDILGTSFEELLSANVLILVKKKSKLKYQEWGTLINDNKVAFRFHKGLIKKYRTSYEVDFDSSKEVFYE